MRLAASILALILGLAIVPQASGDLTPAIEQLLKSIRAADKGQLAVSEEDGRFLRVLVASTGAEARTRNRRRQRLQRHLDRPRHARDRRHA